MDFLLYMCALKGIPAEQGKERALELLDNVNQLDAKANKLAAFSDAVGQKE